MVRIKRTKQMKVDIEVIREECFSWAEVATGSFAVSTRGGGTRAGDDYALYL